MLNYLWAGMIFVGILFGAFHGKMPEITNAALDSSREAVTLCITMVGVMSFWVGLMEIAERSGVLESAFSGTSCKSSGSFCYHCQLYCQFSRARMGGHSCRTPGDETPR